jgi:hypothetical protein
MVARKSLKHLGQNDIANQEGLIAEQAIEAIRLGRCDAPEIVDPNA